ncbi:thiamine pyrophosphate-dependent dehydrogenase E1 component subunit alpha [Dactylosporangium sp. NBC_01737]|uniref:thiamine pyrophosphate-dependent dehydrogenase E1 component subunit alpha n=1 Tax=Dactylosporangium sp. NBC_01737 TaxID=2975959 RepID=UPI002E13071B|nr:thiamine pyrophosphate-dependent dehydrogenase E1 component subunit alpha [Dactylosporangium sp. NBC_01737]
MTLTTDPAVRPPGGPTRLADEDLTAMLLIRHFETRLLQLFDAGRLDGTTHTCLGQEYVPVALCRLLEAGDWIVSNHRGHGHYLARYDDPAGLLAEIMGRDGAICNGVGGSQHLYREGFLSSGVQGQTLPIAAGIALQHKLSGHHALAVVFMGDGTWGEGAVYEALNMAALWRLPLLVVVEHNGIAQSTPTPAHLAGSIAGRAAAFGIAHELVRSTDVNAIRTQLHAAVTRVRDQHRPLVVELRTTRLGPHSKGDDARPAEAVAAARARDWCTGYADRFPEQFAASDRLARQRIDAVVADVQQRPPATWSGR